jgi:RNA polymerase subunit RPABC4/transcription elongation factor Spt4
MEKIEGFYQNGWVCPVCKNVMSPNQSYCIFCYNKSSSNVTTNQSNYVDYLHHDTKTISDSFNTK